MLWYGIQVKGASVVADEELEGSPREPLLLRVDFWKPVSWSATTHIQYVCRNQGNPANTYCQCSLEL